MITFCFIEIKIHPLTRLTLIVGSHLFTLINVGLKRLKRKLNNCIINSEIKKKGI